MASDDEERWVAAGLLDVTSSTAGERRALLAWLEEEGASLEEMQAAAAIGQLNSLAGDRALRAGPRLTPNQLAARLDVDVATVHEIRRASGFPRLGDDEPGLVESDIPMFEVFEAAATFFDRDLVLRLATVMGAAMRRVADAAGEIFLRDVEGPMKAESDAGELELARAIRAAIDLAGAATLVFTPMFLGHVELSTARNREARQASEDYDTLPLAIGFVDLTGFTERSGTLTARELRDMVDAFEMHASGIVHDHGGRVIKLIGDEVMFSAIDAVGGCAIARALVAHAPAGSTARGGLAFGDVVASGGDLYGTVVNLASRLASIAVPGEVLVNGEVVDAAPDEVFEPAGRRSLKGFAEPVRLWSLVF